MKYTYTIPYNNNLEVYVSPCTIHRSSSKLSIVMQCRFNSFLLEGGLYKSSMWNMSKAGSPRHASMCFFILVFKKLFAEEEYAPIYSYYVSLFHVFCIRRTETTVVNNVHCLELRLVGCSCFGGNLYAPASCCMHSHILLNPNWILCECVAELPLRQIIIEYWFLSMPVHEDMYIYTHTIMLQNSRWVQSPLHDIHAYLYYFPRSF